MHKEDKLQDFYKTCKKKHEGKINLSWQEIANIYNLISGNAARKRWQRYLKKNESNKNMFIDKILDNKLKNIENVVDDKRLLKQQLREERRQIETYRRELGRTYVLAEYIQQALESLDIYERKPYKEIYFENKYRQGILQLSDIHDGVIVKPSHTNGYNEYNPDIMEKRMYKLLEEVVKLGELYNLDKINIFGLADYIEHDSMRSTQLASVAYPVVEQMMHFEEFLYNWLVDLSKYFIVEFDGVAGNHDRANGDKFKELKENNYSSLILHMCKLRLGNKHPNIIFNYKFANYTIYKDILGYKFLGRHGHEEGADKIQAMKNFMVMDNMLVDYYLYGHHHTFKVNSTSRGKKAIGNGSVVGANDYSRNVIHSQNNASQNLLIIEEDNGLIGIHEINLQ